MGLNKRLTASYECSDSGPVGYFLGINIHRDRPNKKLFLSQEHYMENLLLRHIRLQPSQDTPLDWLQTSDGN